LALALLLDARGLAAQRTEIVELGAANPAAAHQLERRDRGAVDGEHPLDADAGRHLPDGEVLADAAAPLGDDDALERLEPFLVALANADHDLDGVARLECRNVRAQALTGHFCQPLHRRILRAVWRLGRSLNHVPYSSCRSHRSGRRSRVSRSASA